MRDDLHGQIVARLLHDYQFKQRGEWLRQGRCPACERKSLFTHAETPWVIRCERANKCGHEWHVKDLYSDLFESWSDRYQKTEQSPNAGADAYLQHARGFKLDLIRGSYTQEAYFDHKTDMGSATVRFPISGTCWWERIIDKAHRFGDRKATFHGSYKGCCWEPPGMPADLKEIWIVEGIFDAIALMHHGIWAVAAMSCNNYPDVWLDAIAKHYESRDLPRPAIVWALDGDKAGRTYTKSHVARCIKAGWECTAATIPQGRKQKLDWNDMHQRDRLGEANIKDYRYEGALLLAGSAAEKARLIYGKFGWQSFSLHFDNRLWWFELDMKRYNEAREGIDRDYPQLPNEERQNKALAEAGCLVEIANCVPTALYYQANALTDESWYYFRVDFPHGGPSVKNTFTGSQVSAAGEFKKRLLSIAPGALYTGSGQQLDKIIKHQLSGIQTVQTIDFVGYSKDHGAYVFNDIAVKGGRVVEINDEDFFELEKLSLKSLNQSVRLDINTDLNAFSKDWINDLWLSFGAKGVVAMAFWLGALFAEQIRDMHKSYPFLEIVGEPGAGKSTLVEFLWKLCGRIDYEGFDPSKSTLAARARNFAQVSNLPVVLIEGDRGGEDTAKAKGFDWDELKTAYNGRSVRATGVKNSGNDTREPPFRGAVVISQNAEVMASDAVLQRIVHLHFDVASHTDKTKAAAERLERVGVEAVSGFILNAARQEAKILETIREKTPFFEGLISDSKTVKSVRIAKNHAQIMALVEALATVIDLSDDQKMAALDKCLEIAAERQQAINADHPMVQEFWDVYDFLESDGDDRILNHSRADGIIAINLNHFAQVAADRKQQLPPLPDLKRLLKTSRTRKFIDIRAVNSCIHAHYNANKPINAVSKPLALKCWVFKSTSK